MAVPSTRHIKNVATAFALVCAACGGQRGAGSDTSLTRVRPASETSQTPLRRAKPKRPSTDSRFVMWPGADELPRFESGQLMRVELPASVVVSLGLRPPRPLRMDGTVQTDVLVGQDGYARAVRLVQ